MALLKMLGFDVTPSHANFLWCRRSDRVVKPIYEELKARVELIQDRTHKLQQDAGKALVGAIQRQWPGTSIVALYWPEEQPGPDGSPVTVLPSAVQPDSLVELLRSSAAGRAPGSVPPVS